MFKKFNARCFIVMVFGILIMGLGVCLFNISRLGCGPAASLQIAFGEKFGFGIAGGMIITNTIFFIAEIIWGRDYIGPGTFVNWFGVGTTAEIWTKFLTSFIDFPEQFLGRVIVMILGVLILSLSASIYQTADQGISPYDSLSLIIERKTKFKYHWCRIFTDATSVSLAFLLGGIVNIGTLISVTCLGPFISFYNRVISIPLCYGKKKADH